MRTSGQTNKMAEYTTTNMIPGKVILWCVPRSMSTVLTKCLSAVDGMIVYFQLFSNALSFRGYFSTSTGRDLPMELVGNEVVYDEANDLWEKNAGYRFEERKMSYQTIKEDLERANSEYALAKEMAINDFHPEYFPEGYRHVFLIRDPSRVFTSVRKVAASKLAEIGLIPSEDDYDLIRDDPRDSQPMKWFERQHRLWEYVKENIDANPVVIDASDVVTQPQATIKTFCSAVGFPYNDKLLRLTPALDPTEIPKNFVTVSENFFEKRFNYYERAFTSTQFISPSPQDKGPIPRDQLSDDVIRCVDPSMPFYQEMYESRLRISE